MSARRIAYAWFIYVTLFLAYCVSTLRFLCPPFLKPFYAVPLSIGPKNKHVLFGTKMMRYSWGQWCFALLMQNMWIYCGAGFDLRVLETLTVVEQLFYCTVCTIFPL